MIEKLIIGPSTGWFFAAGISTVREQKKILDGDVRIQAVEIPVLFMDKSANPKNQRLRELIGGNVFWGNGSKIDYIGIHVLDYRDPRYGGIDAQTQVEFLKQIMPRHAMGCAVIHPAKEGSDYPLGYYRELLEAGVPLAFENTGKAEPDGCDLRELPRLVAGFELKAETGFVLDVQHAFEREPTMAYARDLFTLLWNHLAHFHVSGQKGETPHALIHESENAAAIIEFLGWALSTHNRPLILEGDYSGENPGEKIAKEIEFLNRELVG